MSDPIAFYLPDGDGFVATELTRGPWSELHQHGGPPSALMARAIERRVAKSGKALRAARVTVEFLRPITITRFTVATETLRTGRKVEGVGATLRAGDDVVARANALFIRERPLELDAAERARLEPGPDAARPFEFPFFRGRISYSSAFETRWVHGTFGQGPAGAWFRLRVPVVAGETPSPLQRVVVAADSGNGISVALDLGRFTFINPDLTVYLHRYPRGEWVGLDSATTPEPDGVGLADTRLFDAEGAIGRSAQSLVIDERAPA
jgi:Acyl-CoA thioesterase C-terminal domain/Acyl-CoA thioesterase N-terminal domain